MIFAACSTASQGGQQLPTGQSLSTLVAPGARFDARVTRVGPHPHYIANGAAAMVISPDRRQILLMTSGFNRYNGTDGKVVPDQSQQYILLYTIDARGSRLRQTLRVLNSYSGIAWLPDGAGFVVGGGVDDAVHRFARRGSAFAEIAPPIALGHKSGNGAAVKPQAAGIAVSADGCRAIVANYYNDSVSLIDLAGGRVLAEQDLRPGKIDAADSGKPGGEFPFAAAWTNAGEAWVSAPRDRQLVAFSISADTLKVTRRIATIGEPTALLHDRAAHRLYATEDNADRLTIVDLATGRMIAEPRFGFPAALGGDPVRKGLDPNAIAQTRDGRLLVTLGGVNALAVVAPTQAGLAVTALVTIGWYPSAVATSADGRRVFVANRKSPPEPNPAGCAPKLAIYRGQPDACGAANQYIFQLEKSGMLQFPMPTERQLSRTTLQVADNFGLSRSADRAAAEARMAACARASNT